MAAVSDMTSWDNIAIIGRGGSSVVYKALAISTGKFIAVKQMDTDGMTKDQVAGIRGEIETMQMLSHPNIISYLGMQQKPNKIFILLEYAERGSLRQLYQRHHGLNEPLISHCLKQILSGLAYLHSKGIAHRDVKCANCLICADNLVKLADFGASKKFESASLVSGLKGTPHWMAPEVSFCFDLQFSPFLNTFNF
jgi:serine/threonine protein kinase